MTNAIEVQELRKYLHKFQLKDVTFNLPRGTIMKFVGENGAGKTTTIKNILDLQKKDAGKIKLFGKKCRWMNCSSNLKLVWYLKIYTFLKI